MPEFIHLSMVLLSAHLKKIFPYTYSPPYVPLLKVLLERSWNYFQGQFASNLLFILEEEISLRPSKLAPHLPKNITFGQSFYKGKTKKLAFPICSLVLHNIQLPIIMFPQKFYHREKIISIEDVFICTKEHDNNYKWNSKKYFHQEQHQWNKCSLDV